MINWDALLQFENARITNLLVFADQTKKRLGEIPEDEFYKIYNTAHAEADVADCMRWYLDRGVYTVTELEDMLTYVNALLLEAQQRGEV